MLKSRYSIQLQISKDQAQALASQPRGVRVALSGAGAHRKVYIYQTVHGCVGAAAYGR